MTQATTNNRKVLTICQENHWMLSKKVKVNKSKPQGASSPVRGLIPSEVKFSRKEVPTVWNNCPILNLQRVIRASLLVKCNQKAIIRSQFPSILLQTNRHLPWVQWPQRHLCLPLELLTKAWTTKWHKRTRVLRFIRLKKWSARMMMNMEHSYHNHKWANQARLKEDANKQAKAFQLKPRKKLTWRLSKARTLSTVVGLKKNIWGSCKHLNCLGRSGVKFNSMWEQEQVLKHGHMHKSSSWKLRRNKWILRLSWAS